MLLKKVIRAARPSKYKIVNSNMLSALKLAATALTVAPDMCVTYFNFTDQQRSNTYYGLMNSDGTVAQRSDLGLNYDPQGRVTFGEESFSFTTNSNQTMHQGFGK